MQFNNNPYYSPELCNLELLTSIDTAGSYEFDIFAIWFNKDTKTLYYDQDSGCSCPTPSDDHGNDLKEITKDTWYNFNEALKNHYNITQDEINDILSKVKRHLNANNMNEIYQK